MALSHKAMAARGWVRIDPRPWHKLSACWRHADGWLLQHCGHATALWPWALYDPAGRMHLAGGALDRGVPTHGRAWSSLDAATDYVMRKGARMIRAMDRIERRRPDEVRHLAT